VSADVDPDYTEGSELTYMPGVAVCEGTPVPKDLETIEVPPGAWAVRKAIPFGTITIMDEAIICRRR
jgi:AraC family transcriptional regulator